MKTGKSQKSQKRSKPLKEKPSRNMAPMWSSRYSSLPASSTAAFDATTWRQKKLHVSFIVLPEMNPFGLCRSSQPSLSKSLKPPPKAQPDDRPPTS